MRSVARRLYSGLAVAALAAGGVIGLAAPANALPTNCSFYGSLYMSGSALIAEGDRYCPGNGEVLTAFVRIERLNPNGTWTALAGGMGYASYPCSGTAANTYRVWHGGYGWFRHSYTCG